ncbi:hypothetical protein CVT26_003573 [Gymnopilus dilepis]|uniref:Ricin B lectin domain-containing protein n=1 Tax=Gymnopilus dilepis TaxID=231916 RepID=A0A409VS63_9AGAR|nr:hypothetical protein CVT26_003573 [Gymnopilus dilepis]
MKLFYVLASLAAAAHAQFSIGAPKAGSTLVAGQDFTVQIIVPIDTSPAAGDEEASLIIGIVDCGTWACPAPSADLGEVLFIGKYQSQGGTGNTLNSFENFTFTVPTDISGTASIQVQRVDLTTPPVGTCLPQHWIPKCSGQRQLAEAVFRPGSNRQTMKFLYLLSATFATAYAQSPSPINVPKPGTILAPGQKFTLQLVNSIDTSPAAGIDEVSLVIGMVACGTSACPDPSKDLGEVLFIGKYDSQGAFDQFDSFENFTLTVPSDISGAASIQVQHSALLTPPGHAQPTISYTSTPVQVGSGSSTPSGSLNIHPNGDNSKCVGIKGGIFADGTAVDIFDCNESTTQKWQWNGNALTSVNPADESQWCLDAGDQSTWTNGLKMKIWQCFSNLPQQTWTPVTSSGTIKLTSANFCLDLTNGDKTNQNILQIWTCSAGNPNQICPDDMKTLLLSTTFLAAAHGMSIGAPKPFDSLTPGQVATVQLIEPISTSAAAGFDEVGLVIGIVSCGVSACPPPTEDLGEVIFVGKYESQGLMPNTQSTFRNYTFTVPSDISGLAAIDVQHISLLTPPGHSIPGIEYLGVAVQVGVGPSRNIHPINDTEKCVGILGGIYADGTPVDIFDCNGSASQKWQFNGNALTSINPADGSQWCLDAVSSHALRGRDQWLEDENLAMFLRPAATKLVAVSHTEYHCHQQHRVLFGPDEREQDKSKYLADLATGMRFTATPDKEMTAITLRTFTHLEVTLNLRKAADDPYLSLTDELGELERL